MTNDSNSTALVAAPRESMTALQVVENAEKLTKLGQLYATSGFFGQVTASVATAALTNCFLEGLSPVEYRAKYHTFDNGHTGIKSDYIQREFHKLGGEWKFVEWSPTKCDMVFTYKGQTLPFCVTIEEMKANGVAMSGKGNTLKTNWAKFPREMLKARCMATAIRAICPEALEGMYTQEEVADFDRPAPKPVVAAVSPSPIAETTPADYGVCPCGSVKGKRWEDIPTEMLEKIVAMPADKVRSLMPEHRDAIVAELGRREVEEQGEVVEPEVLDN